MTGRRWGVMLFWGVVCCASRLPAAEPVDFVKEVLPLLRERCWSCHGAEKQQSGYRLNDREIAFRGGDLGEPAIVPGKPAESPLLRYISGDDSIVMPPKGERLSADQVALLTRWVAEGASWPDDAIENVKKEPQHWAFRPLQRPAVPGASEGVNPIDAFIAQKLTDAGLEFSPPADRRTLIRRAALDVTGLPPTPEAVREFAASQNPLAYAELIDDLLASPHYGERWARHWLDIVRFAESDGFETNQPRPNAWRYRDYVIAALNSDKPYDQFVREQLAGDLLEAPVATAFLVGGPWDRVKSPDPALTAQQRADELHDMVSTTASTFLGLTVGCARCHSHKFDPISQTDYYALKAVFEGVQHGERQLPAPDQPERDRLAQEARQRLAEISDQLLELEPRANPEGSPGTRVAVQPRLNIERLEPVPARRLRFTVLKTTGAEPCIDELEVFNTESPRQNIALASFGTTARASSTYPDNPIHKLEHLNDGQYGNSRSWISAESGAGWVELTFPTVIVIDRVLWGRDREEKFRDRLAVDYRIEVSRSPDGDIDWQLVASSQDRQPVGTTAATAIPPGLTTEQQRDYERLNAEKQQLNQQLAEWSAVPMAYAGRFVTPPATHRFHRGDAMQPREEVAPGALSSFAPPLKLTADTSEAERRLALARWITDPQNPLTARVIVNRLWHYHFGQGLVTTPSDFGLNGGVPSHPELLDWLAAELIAQKWSLKALHRLILTSRTYQQSANVRRFTSTGEPARLVDGNNRLLWHFPSRRLEAEPLRDTILAVSGQLDLSAGGPGFDLFDPNTNYVKVYNSKREFGPDTFRRMIYQSKWRMQVDDTFGAFDCPDAGQIAPKRNSSITPLQALNLLNGPFLLQQSDSFAKRLEREAGDEPAQQAQRAFELAFGRAPEPAELTASAELIREHGLPIFCRALFSANEFVMLP